MMDWTFLEWLEAASYLVTIVGLPFAIAVFLYEHRRARQNEEEEIYQRLSDEVMPHRRASSSSSSSSLSEALRPTCW